MKNILIVLALLLTPVLTFAAVKTVSGIQLMSSYSDQSQHIVRYYDYDTKVTCYTAQSVNFNTNQVSISCVK